MLSNIREFNLMLDAEDVSNWWREQNWPEETLSVVSRTGFIYEDGEKIAASWMIKTNSPIYLMEWTVGNPAVSWEKRKVAIDSLTEYICSKAKIDGATAILVMTKSGRYIEKLKNNNFAESDINMTHLVRRV